MEKRNMIHYMGTMHPILRKGFFNNFIGREVNAQLYTALGALENSRPGTYPEINNETRNNMIQFLGSSNLGEFAVNFVKSHNPVQFENEPMESFKNRVTNLRTIVYFVTNALNSETSRDNILPAYSSREELPITQDITDEQLAIFYNATKIALTKHFDYLTAATLLQAPKLLAVAGTDSLYEIIYLVFEEICKKTLSFNETIYGLFSLNSCLNSCSEMGINPPLSSDSYIEVAIDTLDEIGFNPSPSLEETPIYLMLAYLIQTQPDLSTSKNFKNKVQHKMFKKITDLTIKPFKLADLDEICSLVGFSKETAIYLNYLAFQNLNVMRDKVMQSKISASTKTNLQVNLAHLLESEMPIPAFLYKDITDVITKAYKSKETTESGIVKDFFLKVYPGTMSKVNLFTITKAYGLFNYPEFMSDARWTHHFMQNPSTNQNVDSNNQQAVQNNVQQNAQQQNIQVNTQQVEQNNAQQQVPQANMQQPVQQNVPNNVPQGNMMPQQNVQGDEQVKQIRNMQQSVQQNVPNNIAANNIPQGNTQQQSPVGNAQANQMQNTQQPIQQNVSNNAVPNNVPQGNMMPQQNTQANAQPNTQQVNIKKNFADITIVNGPVSLF